MGTNPACATAVDCTGGLVCCQQGCQAQTACGAGGNRQICTTSAECPAAFPSCRTAGGAGTVMTCRTAVAVPDAAAPVDAAAD
jgi:hypothetical protein